MAVEVEASGQVDEFLRVLRRRAWWIIVPVALIGSLGVFFAVVVPKKYVSTAKVMVRNLQDITGNFDAEIAAIEGKVAPYNLRSNVRIESVILDLGWPEFRSLKGAEKNEYIGDVLRDLSVDLPSMSDDSGRQLVSVEYKNTSPDRAFSFLDALVDSWKDEVLRRQLQKEKKEELETKEQIQRNQKALSRIRDQESQLRLDNQIPPPRQTVRGPEQPEHPSFTQLTDVENDIAALNDEIEEGAAELERLTEERDLLPQFVDADDLDLGGAKTAEIERIDSKIDKLLMEIDAGGWREGHSDWNSRMRKIKSLRTEREFILSRMEGTGFERLDEQQNQERLALTKDIERKERVLRQKRARLAQRKQRRLTLVSETQRITEAYGELDELSTDKQKLTTSNQVLQQKLDKLMIQVKILDGPDGDPFEELKKPVLPGRATSPNPWIIGIGSILFGLAIGLGLAILLEYSKNCFRSARELSRAMPHPVLGTVNAIRTRRERARAAVVRTVVGGGSLAFVVGVIFVTWAYALNRDALTDSLVDAIDGFRRMLM
ncbi:MAG: Wzz/FepE/Etk N-terminal domain-containing protein [Planctomycetota bacterium]